MKELSEEETTALIDSFKDYERSMEEESARHRTAIHAFRNRLREDIAKEIIQDE